MLGEPKVDRLTRRRTSTRREIVDAAWDVVHEQGWSGLTLRQVGEGVGMRAPSLYSHFPSKLAIVDAMFGEAWHEFDAIAEAAGAAEADHPRNPRAVLHNMARVAFEYFTADPERHTLMNQRPIPGFAPSAEAYAPAVRRLEGLRTELAGLGITDPEAVDVWTALIAGLTNQQVANDPGGERWARLLPRAIDMYADEFGVPRSASRRKASR